MDWMLFAIFLVTCGAAGATGAAFNPGAWYMRLEKPWFTPPNWAFPVAWTSIYLLISFAGARVAVLDGSGYALAFWAAQAGFATLWTPIFFGLRQMKGAILVIVMLWISVLGATVLHWQLDFWAGLAFMPYLAWVTVAAALNVGIVRLNPDVKPLAIDKI
ncbi:tryptophan-rich sensory protein [Roseovarius sp. LXJ103]|uniref:tryptophan-rich sensory protein TspO n=1 Tax=Roseovarius carneus TaxID=2853164 RepID=UPI000D60C206|nr:TspO/MBR family protein [Roseovarius carneus]MBZ8119121.1 tryptophan-rich sensory protein [Roseovarius carneus]PWE35243.1 sensory protein TspO [Pelagicola sp. LXJ1103]